MRRNTALNKDFSRHNAFILHIPPHWKEPCCIFGGKQRTKVIPAIALWSHEDPSTPATEDSCPGTVYTCCKATVIASWLHRTWTFRDSQACGLGESWGRHFIHSELKWDKRHPPAKLPCFKKQLHDSPLPRYTDVSATGYRAKAAFSSESQLPVHSSLAT